MGRSLLAPAPVSGPGEPPPCHASSARGGRSRNHFTAYRHTVHGLAGQHEAALADDLAQPVPANEGGERCRDASLGRAVQIRRPRLAEEQALDELVAEGVVAGKRGELVDGQDAVEGCHGNEDTAHGGVGPGNRMRPQFQMGNRFPRSPGSSCPTALAIALKRIARPLDAALNSELRGTKT